MKKNNTVETAQKGQTTTKDIKVKTLANATERRKEREEKFRNFRINALRRRCKRYGFDEAKTEEYVEKLKKQMDAPKEYSILIMISANDGAMMAEALAKAKIDYKYRGNTYFSLDGNQNILAKIREIAPSSAKIYPYAKKMESVIPKTDPPKTKPKTQAEKKTAAAKAKYARKMKNISIHRNKKTGKMSKRIVFKTLQDVRNHISSMVIQITSKKGSEGLKTAKKAA